MFRFWLWVNIIYIKFGHDIGFFSWRYKRRDFSYIDIKFSDAKLSTNNSNKLIGISYNTTIQELILTDSITELIKKVWK